MVELLLQLYQNQLTISVWVYFCVLRVFCSIAICIYPPVNTTILFAVA